MNINYSISRYSNIIQEFTTQIFTDRIQVIFRTIVSCCFFSKASTLLIALRLTNSRCQVLHADANKCSLLYKNTTRQVKIYCIN